MNDHMTDFAIAGNFSGSNFAVDPVTGFLEFKPKGEVGKDGKTGVGQRLSFTPAQKVLFLIEFKKTWPNISRAAKEVGVCRWTVTNHVKIDVKFSEAMAEIHAEMYDETLSNFQRHGENPKNFLDRMAVARAVFPTQFDPAKKVIMTHQPAQMSPDSARERLGGIGEIVDADVVQAQFAPDDLNLSTPDQTMDKSA